MSGEDSLKVYPVGQNSLHVEWDARCFQQASYNRGNLLYGWEGTSQAALMTFSLAAFSFRVGLFSRVFSPNLFVSTVHSNHRVSNLHSSINDAALLFFYGVRVEVNVFSGNV